MVFGSIYRFAHYNSRDQVLTTSYTIIENQEKSPESAGFAVLWHRNQTFFVNADPLTLSLDPRGLLRFHPNDLAVFTIGEQVQVAIGTHSHLTNPGFKFTEQCFLSHHLAVLQVEPADLLVD